MDVARLLVQVDANTAQAEAGLATLHKQVGLAAIGFGVLVVATAAAGIVAAKMAGDFQKGLETLVTGAGESQKNIKMIGAALKDMAVQTGTSTKELISGLYMINSAGYRGAEGLNVLKVAAEGARSENADLGTVADALTTIMRDYPHVLNGATGAMNTLIGTVENGKTHLQDLAQSLAMVLPTASAAGIGLTDVMAAMATLTGEGVPAANAATYLRQTFINLMAPGAGATKMLREIGLTTQQVSDGIQRDLVGTLQLIEEHMAQKFPRSVALLQAEMLKVNQGTESMDQALQNVANEGGAAYIEAIKAIAGGSKTMQGLLDLTGVHLKDFRTNMVLVGQAVKDGGNQVRGWSIVQQEFNFKMAQLKEVVETAFISLGEHLLPVLTNVASFMMDHVVPAVGKLTQFLADHKAIVIVVAAIIAGALAAAFTVWAATATAAAAATVAATWPVLAIGGAIGGLTAGIIWAYKNLGWFRDLVKLAGDGFGVWLGWIGKVFEALGWLKDRIGDLLGLLGHLKDAVGGLLDSAKHSALHVLGVPGYASGTDYAPGGPAMLAEGGGPELVMRPGIYNVPRGSTVLSAQDTAKALGAGAGGQKSQTINIYPQKADLDADDLQRHLRRVALLASTAGGYA